jgi:cellulose synthase/poly-beta-1,6-N-acetylglucosamine synthase-like glycosyltransferase
VEHSDQLLSSSTIEISVVIPARNEEDSVRALLEGLLSQTLPPAEIVIADCGSIDATRVIVEEFIRSGAPVKMIREQVALPGHGRNVAVAHSCCDWIAFIDAGNTPAPNWLAGLAQRVSDSSAVDVVYGSYEPATDSFFKECAAIAYVPPPFESDGGFVRPCSIVSALMRRRVWETVGGFPEHLRSAEDLVFMHRVEQAKFNIVRTSGAIVFWNIQPNLWRTFKRFVTYSRHNIRAGLFAEWQGRIFIYYALIAASIVPAFFLSSWWFFVNLVLWPLLLMARAVKALRRNRQSYPASHARNFARLCLLIPIIATLDAAAFIGSINWLLGDKVRLTGSRGQDESRG